MKIDTDAGRLRQLRALGAEEIAHENRKFWGIFERAYRLIDGATGVESVEPVITARTSDVSSIPKRGILIVGESEHFRLVRPEPDGNGLSNLVLARA